MTLFFHFVIHVGIIFLIAFFYWRRTLSPIRNYFWPALMLKLMAGIGLGLLYKYYYSAGDTFSFFSDACKLTEVFWDNPRSYVTFLWSGDESDPVWSLLANTQTRSLFFVKIVSAVNILSGSNYWITSCYISFISFWSAFRLVEKINSIFPRCSGAAALAFLFFPSVVFWSSGVIKESIALAGLMFLAGVYIALLANSQVRWWDWLLAMLSAIVVWNLKYYWMAVFIPVVATTLIIHFATRSMKIKSNGKIIAWMILFLVVCFGVTLIHPNFYLERFLQVLASNYHEFIQLSSPGNLVHYDLQPTWWSVIYNSPLAISSGLFRPFIWEASNVLQVIVSIENLFVLTLTLAALFRLPSLKSSSYRLLIFSSIVYILILCLFLALSTPNFGTLARYKVGFQPFLIFILLADSPVLRWLELKRQSFPLTK